MPLRRWISKSGRFEVGSEFVVCDAGQGRVESQRTDRSHSSTREIWDGESGGWFRAIVEMAFCVFLLALSSQV
jgi:hypothetical protein